MNNVRVQEPPNTVKVELTEGCPLRCSFCGLNGIRGKANDYKFLTVPAAEVLVSKLVATGWAPRFEFAMHGEPTMNPNILEIVRMFRGAFPRCSLMMTSNGSGIWTGSSFGTGLSATERVVALFNAGLNTIALNAYQNIQWVPKIWAEASESSAIPKAKIQMLRWPEDKDANPHERRGQERRLIRLFAIDLLAAGVRPEGRKGNHARLANHTGSGAPKNLSKQGKRCGKPFREFAVRWDLNVAICCEDWRGEYKCGNLHESTVQEIWQGPAFVAARHKLYHGLRDFGPCLGCDETCTRSGLLPDKQGKETEVLPTPDDLVAIQKATAGSTFTAPILRPWEIQGYVPKGKLV